ncbi:MAG TPA: site-specific integrase [Leptolyngbyaceae cyanobacterium M65_K2018_010]|nr:site-specific integrase [Leptolyngbyaceae cyanobacterium M65_K2018_010]
MALADSLDGAIAKLNQRLKAARLGLRVERRGDRLALRGTLPPRPGSGRTRPHQQRIPLGLPATKAGLKQIEQEAKVIAARLIERRFSWADYLPTPEPVDPETVPLEEQVAQFQAHLLHCPGADVAAQASLKTTWEKAYAPYLKKLLNQASQHPRQSLGEAIIATLEALPVQTRSRQVGCTALKAFAEFHHIALPRSIDDLWGSYGSHRTQRRELPSDEDILTWFDRIPNPAWQTVYGLMAAYGLRNHEVFFCDRSELLGGDPEARITVLATTKTGLHDVWPFYPEWVDRFGLRQGGLPAINTDLSTTTLQRVGQQVALQFKRYGIPFAPYDLRHAWAVRTIHVGLPDTVAARMMGHSVAIHTRTYHRWITLRDQRQAVRAALHNAALNKAALNPPVPGSP